MHFCTVCARTVVVTAPSTSVHPILYVDDPDYTREKTHTCACACKLLLAACNRCQGQEDSVRFAGVPCVVEKKSSCKQRENLCFSFSFFTMKHVKGSGLFSECFNGLRCCFMGWCKIGGHWPWLFPPILYHIIGGMALAWSVAISSCSRTIRGSLQATDS